LSRRINEWGTETDKTSGRALKTLPVKAVKFFTRCESVENVVSRTVVSSIVTLARLWIVCRTSVPGAPINSNNYSDYSVTRRSADLAVQLRLGLLPERWIRACSADRSDPLVDGTPL